MSNCCSVVRLLGGDVWRKTWSRAASSRNWGKRESHGCVAVWNSHMPVRWSGCASSQILDRVCSWNRRLPLLLFFNRNQLVVRSRCSSSNTSEERFLLSAESRRTIVVVSGKVYNSDVLLVIIHQVEKFHVMRYAHPAMPQ